MMDPRLQAMKERIDSRVAALKAERDEINRRIGLVRAEKIRLGRALSLDELDELLAPVDCLRTRLRKRKGRVAYGRRDWRTS
jgi:hypothetical protein